MHSGKHSTLIEKLVFVEAATGYNNRLHQYKRDDASNAGTSMLTQVNKLEDSFQEYDINAMNTRSTNRSRDSSWNGSFNRSSKQK